MKISVLIDKIYLNCDRRLDYDDIIYMLNNILQSITLNKTGIEIGGPSLTGNILYENSANIDNVIFSKNTISYQKSKKRIFRCIIYVYLKYTKNAYYLMNRI